MSATDYHHVLYSQGSTYFEKPTTRHSSFQNIPQDILSLVLQHALLSDRMVRPKVVQVTALVCRSWRDESQRFLNRSVSLNTEDRALKWLSGIGGVFTTSFIQLRGRAGEYITTPSSGVTTETALRVLQRCPDLVSLEFEGFQRVPSFFFELEALKNVQSLVLRSSFDTTSTFQEPSGEEDYMMNPASNSIAHESVYHRSRSLGHSDESTYSNFTHTSQATHLTRPDSRPSLPTAGCSLAKLRQLTIATTFMDSSPIISMYNFIPPTMHSLMISGKFPLELLRPLQQSQLRELTCYKGHSRIPQLFDAIPPSLEILTLKIHYIAALSSVIQQLNMALTYGSRFTNVQHKALGLKKLKIITGSRYSFAPIGTENDTRTPEDARQDLSLVQACKQRGILFEHSIE